jgi:hypothetical protein
MRFVSFSAAAIILGIGLSVAFLLSDGARHVSGTAVVVDGGRMAGEYLHHGIKSKK